MGFFGRSKAKKTVAMELVRESMSKKNVTKEEGEEKKDEVSAETGTAGRKGAEGAAAAADDDGTKKKEEEKKEEPPPPEPLPDKVFLALAYIKYKLVFSEKDINKLEMRFIELVDEETGHVSKRAFVTQPGTCSTDGYQKIVKKNER
jgi:hypothetical protein